MKAFWTPLIRLTFSIFMFMLMLMLKHYLYLTFINRNIGSLKASLDAADLSCFTVLI